MEQGQLKDGQFTQSFLEGLRETFLRDGAVVLPGFFSADELIEVNKQLDRYALEPENTISKARAPEFYKRHYTDTQTWKPVEDGVASFVELYNNPRLHVATESIVGEGYIPEMSLVMLTRPGTGQAWHQDTSSGKEDEYIVNRLIYPRDTTREAGAVVYVPGSHRQGTIPSGGPQDAMPGEVHVAPAAGTLVFLQSRCYHRVTVNRSNIPRFSVNFRVRPAGAPAGLTRIGVYRTGKWDFSKNQPAQD